MRKFLFSLCCPISCFATRRSGRLGRVRGIKWRSHTYAQTDLARNFGRPGHSPFAPNRHRRNPSAESKPGHRIGRIRGRTLPIDLRRYPGDRIGTSKLWPVISIGCGMPRRNKSESPLLKRQALNRGLNMAFDDLVAMRCRSC